MNPFISHASVRIKGTENNYEPSTCADTKCPKSWPHMHCPFCIKSEVFQDPVILKAHYRVKHVDKGIDFAGLKILRCCEQCDIVGTIKGTKEFKGAHWHCYKCRNGFTRRDEAVKHYRTHFRNPSTTFQIQVAQDITQSQTVNFRETSIAADGIPQELHLETVVTEPDEDGFERESPPPTPGIITTMSMDKAGSGELHVSVAANETVDACEGQTIMIIQDGAAIDGGEIVGTIQHALPVQPPHQVVTTAKKLREVPVSKVPGILSTSIHWRKEKTSLEQQVRELHAQNTELLAERTQTEQQLREENATLRAQLQMMSAEIVAYQKREEELVDQLKIPLDDRLASLLAELKDQHEELLHQQLAQIRRSYFQQHSTQSIHQGEAVDQGAAQEMSLDAHVSDMNLVVQDDTHVLTTVDGTRTVVLHRDGHTYRAVGPDGLSAANIVLTSESLIAGNHHSSPIFVMPQTSLQNVKVEDGVVGTAIETIEDELLQPGHSTSPLVQYATEVTSGDYASTEVPSGDYTNTEVTSGDYTNTEVPSGDYTSTEVTSGDFTSTEVTSGDFTSTEVTSGDYTTIEVPSGDYNSTEVPSGDYSSTVVTSVVEDVSQDILTVEQVSEEQLEADSDAVVIQLGISGKRKIQFTDVPKSKHRKE